MNSIKLYLRLLRRAARRLRQQIRYGSLAASPILVANSFPKSGTHLLTQVMEGFTRAGPAVNSGLPAIVAYQGDTGRQRAESEIMSDLQRLRPGDIAYGHIHALPGPATFLRQPGIAAYFILRDPRDVVVSHVHYITSMAPSHIHHHYYQENLHTFEERLTASIVGINIEGVPLPDIRQRFEPYIGWLEYPEVLTLRYEDFIASPESQNETLGKVFDYAQQRGFHFACPRPQALHILAASINPKRSPTFRSGKIGGWKKSFAPEHKRIFKDVAGDLLIRLGYETSQDW